MCIERLPSRYQVYRNDALQMWLLLDTASILCSLLYNNIYDMLIKIYYNRVYNIYIGLTTIRGSATVPMRCTTTKRGERYDDELR